jgi:hypothetical protein
MIGEPCPLSAAGWRAFRLFLAVLDDQALLELQTDADLESCTRIERDGIGRVFFTSLRDQDLSIACNVLERELGQRQADLAKVGGPA